MSTLTDTGTILQKPINAVFNQVFLRRAQQVCPYFNGTSPGQINEMQGTSTIKWRRIEQETPSTTALSEQTTAAYLNSRTADTPTFTDVLATLAKYGQYYIVNEEVDLYQPNGNAAELVAVLGESAGRSLNELMRDVMEDNATQRFAANVASTAAVHAVVAVGDLDRIVNELTKNAARVFSPLTNGSTNVGTAPILPSYWGICHPDVAYTLSGLATGWTSVEKYAGQTAIVPGEFGIYSKAGRGVRFVMAEDASVDLGAGAALSGADLNSTSSKVDIYTCVVYGQDAFGSVGLGKKQPDGIYRAGDSGAWEMISHPKGSAGSADPFNEISTIAWKAFYAGCVLNSNWSRSLRSGATNLTN